MKKSALFFSTIPPWRICLWGLILIGVLGLVDHASGPEISFSVFYLIPVSFTGWYGGKRMGLMMSVVSALTWLVVDFTSGHVYSQQ